VARIEPRTRRWYRGQHHGSAGTFILKTIVLKLERVNFLRSLVLSIAFSAKYIPLKKNQNIIFLNEFAKD